VKLFDLAKRAARRLLGRRTLKGPVKPSIVPPPFIRPGQNPVIVPPTSSSPGPPPVSLNPLKPRREPPKPEPVRPEQVRPEPAPKAQPTQAEVRDIKTVQEVYDNIKLLGRDASYDDDDAVNRVMDKMRIVKSSNVWGYYFELDDVKHSPTISSTSYGKRLASYGGSAKGLLYVTFLSQSGTQKVNNAPGATYVYFDVPVQKFNEFTHSAEASAGKAVWDYLRVRGSVWQHQHRYRFLQNEGEYIPRKATKQGFKTRTAQNPLASKIPNEVWSAFSRLERSSNADVRDYGAKLKRELLSKAGHRRSTLPARSFISRGAPNRGRPNDGRKG
jgi:hypothetical protein